MARKGGGSTQRMAPPPTTNVHTNGNTNAIPPPSTIAAQIVHNAANVHSRQDAAAKVTFGELVKEFLQHPGIDEPDVQLVALISVIVEAGLESLFKEDPFAQDQQRQQGINSINALMYLLDQKPHLLLSAKDSEDGGSPQPPLIIWLFPKLMGLLTHTTLHQIHQHIQGLLSLCLDVLTQTSTYSRKAVAVMQLYKSSVACECLDLATQCLTNLPSDIRNELKAANDPVALQSTPFRIAVPSSSSLNEFWPESKQSVAVPHNLQRIIASPTSAIYVSFNLLMALCAPTRQKSQKHVGSAPFEQQYPWILDTCEELWHYFRRWTASFDKRALFDETTTLYMQLLDALAIPGLEKRDCFSSSGKAGSVSVSSVSRLIQSLTTSPMSDTNQLRLALMVTRLYHVAKVETKHRGVFDRRRRSPHTFDTNSLEYSAKTICGNTEVFSSLQKDLQVRRTK